MRLQSLTGLVASRPAMQSKDGSGSQAERICLYRNLFVATSGNDSNYVETIRLDSHVINYASIAINDD